MKNIIENLTNELLPYAMKQAEKEGFSRDAETVGRDMAARKAKEIIARCEKFGTVSDFVLDLIPYFSSFHLYAVTEQGVVSVDAHTVSHGFRSVSHRTSCRLLKHVPAHITKALAEKAEAEKTAKAEAKKTRKTTTRKAAAKKAEATKVEKVEAKKTETKKTAKAEKVEAKEPDRFQIVSHWYGAELDNYCTHTSEATSDELTFQTAGNGAEWVGFQTTGGTRWTILPQWYTKRQHCLVFRVELKKNGKTIRSFEDRPTWVPAEVLKKARG